MNTKYKLLTTATLSIALSTGTVHADGFFSNLFGGSKNSADLKTLLTFVPADTAYLVANKEPIPEKVMDAHMQRGKDILAMFVNSESMKKAATHGKGPEKFFSALLEDYGNHLTKDTIEEIGLTVKANSVFYGYEMMPVVRVSIADKEKMMSMIKRAEEKSSYKVEFTKCGEYDCFDAKDLNSPFAISAVFLKGHIAVAAFSPDKEESLKKHLMGESKPSATYTLANWDTFLKENNYPGYGDGFIKLKNIYAFAKPLIKQNAKGAIGMDEKSLDGCLAVAENHIDNMPEIVFGTKALKQKTIDYELLFKTSEVVSTALQTLANDTNIPQRTEGAIFDVGININFTKMRDALTKYSSFLIKSGEENKCPAIKAQDIRKGMGGMAMVMNMGLSQFNSVYASVSDVELDKNMQPKKINAVVSLGSNDPAGLIAMAGMMVPPLMSLDIPDDGSVVKLPEDFMPKLGSTPQPEVFLSRTKKAINVFVGNDKPALKAHSNETSEISFSSMDIQSYLKTITGIIESLPAGVKNQDDMPDMEMLKMLSKVGIKTYSTTSANKRGLAINYHIEY